MEAFEEIGAARALTLARWEAALAVPGCPACRLASDAGRDYLIRAVREGKSHSEVYERIREAGGFCEEHTRILRQFCAERVGDCWSVARLYGWLLDDGASLVPLERECPACEAAAKYGEASLAALRNLLHPQTGDATFRTRFAEGPGLCRGHFAEAATMMEDRETLRILVETQARGWDALARDLKEYLRKHDYRFSHEPKTAAEDASWVCAVTLISGEPVEGADRVS
jgi:hypothetical protein